MVARFLPADDVFFDEWTRLRRRTGRSVTRAAAFAEAMDVSLNSVRSIVVVGSKGKATAATYASTALAGAGLRVGTITSPPILTNRERIRIDGVAISEAAYEDVSRRAAAAQRRMPPATLTSGYLSPAGMYLIAGIDYLRREGCDVIVAEAGMGARSDEVSLLSPAVIAVTPIFAEHVGILGETVEEIAEEKLSIAGPGVMIVSAPQSPAVLGVMERLSLHVAIVDGASPGQPGIGGVNAAVGVAAARAYAGEAATITGPVCLPGRLSELYDERGRYWLVDAPVDAVGIASAFDYARSAKGEIDRALVSLPDSKDVKRSAAWLDANVGAEKWRPVIPPHAEHLSYSPESWGRPLMAWQDVDSFVENACTIAALGSWSFLSAVLARLDVHCERSFEVTTCRRKCAETAR